jgi:hypothetical protein
VTPKHPIDKDLQEYLDIRSSSPPPAIEKKAHHKVIKSAEHARVQLETKLRDAEMDTGIHLLSKFDEIQKALTQTEIDKRIAAEAKVSAIIKWFAVTLSGIVVILVSGGIIWLVTQANKVK